MLTLLPHLLCSPSPPFCFPVTPAAEIQLTSLSLDGISAPWSRIDVAVLQEQAGRRWARAATGQEQGGAQGHSQEPARGMFDIPAPASSGEWPIPLSMNTAADSLLYKY